METSNQVKEAKITEKTQADNYHRVFWKKIHLYLTAGIFSFIGILYYLASEFFPRVSMLVLAFGAWMLWEIVLKKIIR